MIPTSFSQLIGNTFIKECLQRLIKKKNVGHSLLFAGPEGIGKSLFATVLAALVMSEDEDNAHQHSQKIAQGMHPDVHIYKPEGKIGMHSIQSLRQMCDEIHLPPYEAKYKIFIVHDAHRMLTYSANALLKTFEEPPPQTKIILLTHAHKALLPTILSRCSSYFFQSIDEQEIYNYLKKIYPQQEQNVKVWANLSQGSLGQALKLAKRGEDHLRTLMLNAFSNGSLHNYKSLLKLSELLVQEIEARKKSLGTEIKEIQYKKSDCLTASQIEMLEKEVEGTSALELVQETNILFYTILSWYRDLSLLQAAGDRRLLINLDYENALEAALQFDQLLPLEDIQKAIEETQLALQRSTSLNICIENLLLKLVRF